jgi:hypothetical protein
VSGESILFIPNQDFDFEVYLQLPEQSRICWLELKMPEPEPLCSKPEYEVIVEQPVPTTELIQTQTDDKISSGC